MSRKRRRKQNGRHLDLEDYFGGTRSSLEAHGADVGRGTGGYNGWADAELPGDVEEYMPSPDVPIPSEENPVMMPSFAPTEWPSYLGGYWAEHIGDWEDAWTGKETIKDKFSERLGYSVENYNPYYKEGWWGEDKKPSKQKASYGSNGEVPEGYKEVRFLARTDKKRENGKQERATSAIVKHMQEVYEEYGIPNAPRSPAQIRREKRKEEEKAKKIARKEREIRKKQKEQEEFDSHIESATPNDWPSAEAWEDLWENAVPELYEKAKEVFDPWKQFNLRDQSQLEAHGADVGRGIGGSNNAKLQELAKQRKLLAEIEENTRVEEGIHA